MTIFDTAKGVIGKNRLRSIPRLGSNAVVILMMIAGAVSFVKAQNPAPRPTATPSPDQEVRDVIIQREAANRRFEAMRHGSSYRNNWRNTGIYIETIEDNYRKPTREEAKLLHPKYEDSNKYANFLKMGNTGLTTLIDDYGCSDNFVVVVASEECLKYTMPGGGASFSFRIDNYRIWRLADLTYSGGKFHSLGVFSQGMIVDLGDIPLEKVSIETAGMGFLSSFRPVTEFDDAKKLDLMFVEGFDSGGFFYSRSVNAVENRTFGIRSIAYRGTVKRSYHGITYDELDFDKRKDIIVVFRIVRIEAGSVTILWKELDRKDAPKIKTPVKDYRE